MSDPLNQKPQYAAIAVCGGDVHLEGFEIKNADVGIWHATSGAISTKGIRFKNTTTPYRIESGSTGRIEENKVVNDPKLRRGLPKLDWRRPKGPPLPSYCPECKNIFPSRNYVFSGTDFYLWGNTEECVVCGYEGAELSKGVFDLSRETVEILRAPEITKQMVKRLAELGNAVASGRLQPEEAIAAAEEIHPTLGRAAALLFTGLTYAYFMYASIVGTVSATMDLYDRMKGASPTVINQMVIEQVLRQHDQLWHEKLEHPQGNVIGQQPSGNSDKIATSEKSRSEITQPRPESRQEKKKRKKREKLKNHRQSFGGARSR